MSKKSRYRRSKWARNLDTVDPYKQQICCESRTIANKSDWMELKIIPIAVIYTLIAIKQNAPISRYYSSSSSLLLRRGGRSPNVYSSINLYKSISSVSIVDTPRAPYFSPEDYQSIPNHTTTKSIRKKPGKSVLCIPAFFIQWAYSTPSLAMIEKVLRSRTLFSIIGIATYNRTASPPLTLSNK